MLAATYFDEFIEFAQTLNYAKAAKALYISQPTLRTHIRALEAEVGAALTARHNGRLYLTSTGKFVLERAREVVACVDGSLAACRAYALDHISIMVGDTGIPALLEAVEAARQRYCTRRPRKSVDIRISSHTSSNLDALRNCDVDLILLSRVPRGGAAGVLDGSLLPADCLWRLAKTTHLQFWAESGSPLSAIQNVRATDLEGLTLSLGNTDNMRHAGDVVQRALAAHGVTIAVEHSPFDSYSEYFFSGSSTTFGITLREASSPHGGIHRFELSDLPIPCELFAVLNARCMREGADEFLDALVQDLRGAL